MLTSEAKKIQDMFSREGFLPHFVLFTQDSKNSYIVTPVISKQALDRAKEGFFEAREKDHKILQLESMPIQGITKFLGGDFILNIRKNAERYGCWQVFYVFPNAESLASYLSKRPWQKGHFYGTRTLLHILDGRDCKNLRIIDPETVKVEKTTINLVWGLEKDGDVITCEKHRGATSILS